MVSPSPSALEALQNVAEEPHEAASPPRQPPAPPEPQRFEHVESPEDTRPRRARPAVVGRLRDESLCPPSTRWIALKIPFAGEINHDTPRLYSFHTYTDGL
jgi:hypothetical protein